MAQCSKEKEPGRPCVSSTSLTLDALMSKPATGADFVLIRESKKLKRTPRCFVFLKVKFLTNSLKS